MLKLNINQEIKRHNKYMINDLEKIGLVLRRAIVDASSDKESDNKLFDEITNYWNKVISVVIGSIPGVLPAGSSYSAERIMDDSKEVCDMNHKITKPIELVNLYKHITCINIVFHNVDKYDDISALEWAELLYYTVIYTILDFENKINYHIYPMMNPVSARQMFTDKFNKKSDRYLILNVGTMGGDLSKDFCRINSKNVDNKSAIRGKAQTFVAYIPRKKNSGFSILYDGIMAAQGLILFNYPTEFIAKRVNHNKQVFLGTTQPLVNRYPNGLHLVAISSAYDGIITSVPTSMLLTAKEYYQLLSNKSLMKQADIARLPDVKRISHFDDLVKKEDEKNTIYNGDSQFYLTCIYLGYLFKRDVKSSDSIITTNSYTMKLINHCLKHCCQQLLSKVGKEKGTALIGRVMKRADTLMIDRPYRSVAISIIKGEKK